jgi:hypothetical protein
VVRAEIKLEIASSKLFYLHKNFICLCDSGINFWPKHSALSSDYLMSKTQFYDFCDYRVNRTHCSTQNSF